jgi:MYXO-CTERM domain-containing protein
MLRSLWRQLFAVLFVTLIVACSGGGCSSGCSSCGTKPLAGGFPKADTIQNAASVRVTRAGLDFVGTNIGTVAGKLVPNTQGGVINFDIPDGGSQTVASFLGVDVKLHVCPGGPNPNANPPTCRAEIQLGNAKLRLDAANYASANGLPAIRIAGTIPIRVKDLPVNVSVLGDVNIGVGEGGCNGGTPNVDWWALPIEIILPLVNENISPRDGYTKIDVDNAVINPSIDNSKIQFCKGCGFFTPVCNGFLSAIKGLVTGQISKPLVSTLKSTLKSSTCTAPNKALNPQCPTGSQPSSDGKTCEYLSKPGVCVPTLLGLDGNINLAGFLASVSPGSEGGLDFVLAAGGDMIPSKSPGVKDPPNNQGQTGNGMTLTFLGGAKPVPQSGCVPAFDNKIPTGIPVPDEMQSNTVTPWSDPAGPMLGIALAGRYLDYTMGSVYNSGFLCLGISTEQFAQLQSGLLSVLIPGMKKLTFEQKAAPVAITTRPQSPPKIKLGGGTDLKTDPLMLVQLPSFSVDFYVWSMDRFIRAMTFTGDLSIPINLSTAVDPQKNPNGGLLPALGDIGVQNAKVTNSDVLTDDPAIVAGAIGPLFGGIIGQALGNLKPIDLASSLSQYGLGLTIPAGGIRKLTKGSDDFLAIFANLALAKGTAVQQADVQARILDKTVHPEAMGLATADRAKLPELHVEFGSSLDNGAHAVEYSYAVDQGTRSEWSSKRNFVIKNDSLFLQGKHVLHVYAREKDVPESESTTPADVPFTIDVLAPQVSLDTSDDGALAVKAWDIVSDDSALTMRFRTTDAVGNASAWSAWGVVAPVAAAQLAGASSVQVEVKDEEGNVASQSSSLIRGKPDGTLTTAGGCGCSTPGTTGPNGFVFGLPALAALLGLGLRRRRGEKPAPAPSSTPTTRGRRSRAALLTLASVAVIATAYPGCSCGGDDQVGTGCGADCNQPCEAPLEKGLIGAYTSVAVAKDGTTWVSGYDDAYLSNGQNILYGDFVIGKYDSGKQQVQWQILDGLPPAATDGTCAVNDPRGWRAGLTDPGDDVGLWSALTVDGDGHPIAAYYDATNRQLKGASWDGSQWFVYVIKTQANADIGRYVKMITVGGNPVIAFLTMEKGTGGKTRSKVVVGKANKALPTSGSDWAFEDAAVDETGPCQASFCDGGQVCVKSSGSCTATATGCTPADCGTGNACVSVNGKATCTAVLGKDAVQAYPNAYGAYVSLAVNPKGGFGIVMYDRIRGNLVALVNAGGKWTPTILDGETGVRPNAVDTGDMGIGASLTITANGDWHVSYVNGIKESLQYLVWPGGAGKPGTPEVVDDGYDNGKPYPDGKHIVGDDSTIDVDGGGVVRIAYQDATAGKLRVANGAPSGATHKWTAKAVAQTNRFGGFFPRFVPGTPSVTNFYRETDKVKQDVTGDVAFVTP